MGTQEGERDWVNVANDLFNKCHLNRSLGTLTDCDANVFITLYENIVGDKVPDYIAEPSSQEHDVHNVQSVIDSLSLDYLQISLSHITGENVVRGDGESIKNLLEIFDGLLEYLNEEISDESQNGEEPGNVLNEDVHVENEATNHDGTDHMETKEDGATLSSSEESIAQSSKHSLHSWRAEEIGSASELIGLGVSARTFTGKRADTITPSGPMDSQDAPPTEPRHFAIALQPPNQSNTPHKSDADPPKNTHRTLEQPEEDAAPVATEITEQGAETMSQSPAASEKSLSRQQRTRAEEEGQTLEPTNRGVRRVLFRTQPDVLFLTLQDEKAATIPSPPDTDNEDLIYAPRICHREGTRLGNQSEEEFGEHLPHRRHRNKKAEKELHQISAKLSHRLEELDEMLRRILRENGELIEDTEEDKQSHHSDSVMECRKTPKHTSINTERLSPEPVESTYRTRSLSPSPPREHRPLQRQCESATSEALPLDDGRQTNVPAPHHSKQKEPPQRQSHRKQSKLLEDEAFEEELKRYDDTKQADLDMARLQAQEAEREYREAILRDRSRAQRPSQPREKFKVQPNTATAQRPRKAPSLKVKEDDLLPVLRDELPFLHVSPRALCQMWEEQTQQADRLRAMASSANHQHHLKLTRQLEEMQRKHDLLLELVSKDHEHKKRLRDFKERIQQQKSTQSRLREQRQQMVRAKKYHNDFHVQHRARLMKARTKEEKMFRKLFEDGLEIQKVHLRDQRAYAKEQQLVHQKRQQNYIKSMENYYKDQFSFLAEKLAHERQENQDRKKAQEKALLKMKRELRSRMEHEIGELQKIVVQNNEDDFYQELEVQGLRNRIHMASFQYNTSYLH